MNNLPIGVFDSGVGGLTVVSALKKMLPNENIIYFGDVARTPYGIKSEHVIKRFSLEITSFLIDRGVKIIVIACNTASAVALSNLKQRFKLPIIDVIEPGVNLALKTTKNKNIGIIGTQTTIQSRSYQEILQRLDPQTKLVSKACPLFVPLVEEGWFDHKVTRMVAEEYLKPMKDIGIDTLILGCTHYPLLKNVIQEVMGNEISLIDSAYAVAQDTKEILFKLNLFNKNDTIPYSEYYVSDDPMKFAQIGERFLGEKMNMVYQIDLEKTHLKGAIYV
jgi:glutamate racemase